MRGRHRLRRISPRLAVGLVLAVPIATGGLAGAQESGDSMDFSVQSGYTITVSSIAGDNKSMRQSATLTGISGTISEYGGDTPADVIEVMRYPTHAATQDALLIVEDNVAITVQASGLSCATCGVGDGPGTSAGPVTIPVSDRLDAENRVVTWVPIITGIDTGMAAATANLAYTVTTDGATAGTYSYVITFRIRAPS